MSYFDNIIIDGNNLLFRAFYVKRPPQVINGVNTTPVHQFLTMLKHIVEKFQKPGKLCELTITWDKKLNPTKKNFRKELVQYKENRQDSEKLQELLSAIEHIQKFTDALGFKTILPVNMEADDVIRYLTMKENVKSIIVSNDKDLLQLVSDNVSVYLPNKKIVINVDNFSENVGVEPKYFLLYKSIMGDVSDNITGLYNYGPVRAKILAEKVYRSEEPGFDTTDLSEQYIEIISRNLKVVDLAFTEKIYPDEYEFYKVQEKNSHKNFDKDELKNLFKEYKFVKFLSSFGEWNRLFNKNYDPNDLLSCISM